MILDLFKYFAKFPELFGVLTIFNNGESILSDYATLKAELEEIRPHSLIPEIQHYVFGQSFEGVKKRIDSISGTFLFVDFGEFSSVRDQRNSIHDTQKLAVTVAMKVPTTSDLVEEAIISEKTLQLINILRARMLDDSKKINAPWLKKLSDTHDIIPFVAPELGSLGWSMRFDSEGSDLFAIKDLIKSFNQ
ncbi:hypothetical protein [Phocaeicola sartorii]|uniref:hypothetical protein n=1 Tax=Phocaeicola sartorii TaxID=671267 RepID=UPI003514FE96